MDETGRNNPIFGNSNFNHQNINNNLNINQNQAFNNKIEVSIKSTDGEINIKLKCNPNDKFYKLEEKLYQIYPNLGKTNNYFVFNGRNIIRFNTLKENNIKNGNTILILDPIKQSGTRHIFGSNSLPNNNNFQMQQKTKIISNFNSPNTMIDENQISDVIISTQFQKMNNALGQHNLLGIYEVIKNTNQKERLKIKKLFKNSVLNNNNNNINNQMQSLPAGQMNMQNPMISQNPMLANTNNMNNPNNMTNQNNIHNNFGNNENYTNEINNLFNMFNFSRYKKGVNAYSSYLIIGCFLTPSEY